MLSMDDIGYFLYMEQQEQEEKELIELLQREMDEEPTDSEIIDYLRK